MSWIDEEVKREKEAEARRRKISDDALGLVRELLNEIDARIAEAKSKGKRVLTALQGAAIPYDRQFSLDSEQSESKRMLNLKHLEDQAAFEVTGDLKQLTLTMDLNAKGETCLMHDGKPVSIPKAGQLILKPFLFP
jgi:hypothetical protein